MYPVFGQKRQIEHQDLFLYLIAHKITKKTLLIKRTTVLQGGTVEDWKTLLKGVSSDTRSDAGWTPSSLGPLDPPPASASRPAFSALFVASDVMKQADDDATLDATDGLQE